MMLGYVFWHAPSAEQADGYEAALSRFHEALAAAGPAGLLGSRSLRYAGLAWVEREGPVYEDWYFLASFQALGVLNDAAIAEGAKAPHDRVAARTGWGAGGLYRLLRGLRAGGLPGVPCQWFSKPRGTSYAEFLDGIPEGEPLWRRQLVLGPAPEFCLASGASPRIGEGVVPVAGTEVCSHG